MPRSADAAERVTVPAAPCASNRARGAARPRSHPASSRQRPRDAAASLQFTRCLRCLPAHKMLKDQTHLMNIHQIVVHLQQGYKIQITTTVDSTLLLARLNLRSKVLLRYRASLVATLVYEEFTHAMRAYNQMHSVPVWGAFHSGDSRPGGRGTLQR